MKLYDYPEYYEVAFSFRDIEKETDFLEACIDKFSFVPVRRVFEIACGPAPHAGALTRRGYHYVGLDRNRHMLDHASYKWQRLGPAAKFVDGDMADFAYDDPVDFAFVMLGSLYLNSLSEMKQHFDCVARILRPGGLYFLDWCIQFSDPLAYQRENAYVQERDGVVVESSFNIRLLDAARQMYEEIWTVNVNDHGRQRRFEMIERNRAVYPQEFLLFVEGQTAFEFVGWWHEWDLSKPIDGATDINRPVALLRRK